MGRFKLSAARKAFRDPHALGNSSRHNTPRNMVLRWAWFANEVLNSLEMVQEGHRTPDSIAREEQCPDVASAYFAARRPPREDYRRFARHVVLSTFKSAGNRTCAAVGLYVYRLDYDELATLGGAYVDPTNPRNGVAVVRESLEIRFPKQVKFDNGGRRNVRDFIVEATEQCVEDRAAIGEVLSCGFRKF
jgi:hypothetical protein